MKKSDSGVTTIRGRLAAGLGEFTFFHPPGTFALTPASFISLQAIATNQNLLSGIGLDWGTGTGCLAIAAARLTAVQEIVGLEIDGASAEIALKNARLNGVEHKVRISLSDSYTALEASGQKILESLRRRVNFILANPPASDADDGFGYRRDVLRGAREYLVEGGVVLLSISSQYGKQRIENLTREAPGFVRGGILASSEWVPFDLGRADLLRCLETYAREETRGGEEYDFRDPEGEERSLNARAALARFHQTGKSPLSKWQTRLFRFDRRPRNSPAPATSSRGAS